MSFTDTILTEIKKHDLQKWKLSHNQLKRKEFYFLNSDNHPRIDQNRTVRENSYVLDISIKKDNDRLGRASVLLTEEMDVAKTVHQLIQKAALTDEKVWNYSSKQDPEGSLNLCYPAFLQDFDISTQLVADKLLGAIDRKQACFNSAELFLSLESQTAYFSNGTQVSESRSKIYAEVCYSSGTHEQAQEYLVYKMGAHPEQIDFEQMIEESVEYAQALESAELPESGNYSVKIEAEVFAQLLHDAVSHLDLSQNYYKLPFKNKDNEFVKDYTGPGYQVTSSVHDDFAFGSHQVTAQGDLSEDHVLVKGNRVIKNLASQQMLQYLNKQEAVSLGNLKVDPDEVSDPKAWSKDEPVLEVLQFSGLFSSPRDLSYSSEIRLARLWQPGQEKPVYVKGGSLNGKFSKNFKSIKFSEEKVSLNLNENSLGYSAAYIGPKYACITDVSITS